ncbi:MAG: DUF1361 domain-containing protein [Cyanobacteria bacterium J055]|nr:MAG: DUF1361 domain-containing protein [Cyanobacteria bacterium J055]
MNIDLINWISFAWQALLKNRDWMTWNLFLAVLPWALSLWLFGKPRSRWLRWGVVSLTVATFIPHASHALQSSLYILKYIKTSYLIWAIALTAVLMGFDRWKLKGARSRSLLWWLGFLVFIAFLPNAPYVLTDIIHLVEDIRFYDSIWLITLILIPQYLIFMGLGFQAYVLSLMRLGTYLETRGWKRFVVPAEFIVCALSAIGIYMGRFRRFNSWDLVTQPDRVVAITMDDLASQRPFWVTIVTFAVITGLYFLMKWVTESIGLAQQSRSMAVLSNK